MRCHLCCCFWCCLPCVRRVLPQAAPANPLGRVATRPCLPCHIDGRIANVVLCTVDGSGMAGDLLVGVAAQLVGGLAFTPIDIVKERLQVGGKPWGCGLVSNRECCRWECGRGPTFSRLVANRNPVAHRMLLAM